MYLTKRETLIHKVFNMIYQTTFYAYEIKSDWFVRWFDDHDFMYVSRVEFDTKGDVILHNQHGTTFTLKPYTHVERG